MNRFTLAIAALALTAGAAQAAAPTVTATLKAPATVSNYVTQFVIWKCNGTTCTSHTALRDSATPSACKTLAGKFGEITAYGTEGAMFDATQLAACNAK